MSMSVFATLSPGAAAAPARLIKGYPRVIDGDSLEIKDTSIRLEAIDAPEMRQTCYDSSGAPCACGVESRNHLSKKINGSRIVCTIDREDRFGRSLGYCSIDGKGQGVSSVEPAKSLNAWMVRSGQAMAYRRFTTIFVPQEDYARSQNLGIWSGEFMEPWVWRQTYGRGGDGQSPADKSPDSNKAGCDIKGNISSSGEKIYHLPDGKFYDQVKITESKGERWFCSEEEAVSMGWRPSRE